MEFNQERISQYRQALEDKIFILGKETTRKGLKADYSHLDFLFSVVKFHPEGTRLDDMTLLWATLWEYLGPVLSNYEKLSSAFFMLEEDQAEEEARFAEAYEDFTNIQQSANIKLNQLIMQI